MLCDDGDLSGPRTAATLELAYAFVGLSGEASGLFATKHQQLPSVPLRM